MWPPAPNPPTLDRLDQDVVDHFGRDLLTRIQIPGRGADRDAGEVELAAVLKMSAAGDRSKLARLRSYFIDRLHRPGSDLAASSALRLTERALRSLPRDKSIFSHF